MTFVAENASKAACQSGRAGSYERFYDGQGTNSTTPAQEQEDRRALRIREKATESQE
ncbi:MAG: hypothetical protein ACYTEL_15065 [Planctomycetota bacterium]|jgi:hypothetical protein